MKSLKGTSAEQLKRCFKNLHCVVFLLILSYTSFAQGEARVSSRISATQITVGDQVRVFLEAQINPSQASLQWVAIPDSFGKLEVVERGKIDTVNSGNFVTYKQRIIITGFDSGIFQVPPFEFSIKPSTGDPYTLKTDSFKLLVQTLQVDTTKAFKPIKGILLVKTTWLDYLWYIVGGVLLVLLIIGLTIYFMTKKKLLPAKPAAPPEPIFDKAMRLLGELEEKQLWQKDKIKEYYVELTDIVRAYIEERFHTPALELTTDEFLAKARVHRELQMYHTALAAILHTADLAKFAKAKPLPQEHMDAMDQAKEFVRNSKPIVLQITNETETKI